MTFHVVKLRGIGRRLSLSDRQIELLAEKPTEIDGVRQQPKKAAATKQADRKSVV